MNYCLEILPEFTVIVKVHSFRPDTCVNEIPKFWNEYYAEGLGEIACGQFGICLGCNEDGSFNYGIGNRCDVVRQADGSCVYHIFGNPQRTQIPAGFELRTIPTATWMKIEARGPLPGSIQNAYPEISANWPNGLERLPGIEIEEYGYCATPEDAQKEDYLCWIWIPVRVIGSENFSVKTNVLTAAELNRLGRAVGWEMPPEDQSAAALQNTNATFSLYHGEELIGMARLVGDGAMAYMVREVAVLPEYQKQGAGTILMLAVSQWIANETPAHWRVSCELFAAKGTRTFYSRCGFIPLPHSGSENGMSKMIAGTRQS